MKRLVKYVNGRTKKVHAIIGKRPAEFTVELFHELRVELKKIRFAFELVNSCVKKFRKKKIKKPIDLLFKRAGAVRDAQVQKMALQNYRGSALFARYEHILDEKEQRGQINFFLFANEIDKSGLSKAEDRLQEGAKSVSKKDVIKYLEEEKYTVDKLLEKDLLQPEDLHEMRKQLKKISYTEKVLHVDQGKDESMSDALSVVLGEWHDNHVIIDHLNHAQQSPMNTTEEAVFLEKIIVDLISKNDQYREEIDQKIDLLKKEN